MNKYSVKIASLGLFLVTGIIFDAQAMNAWQGVRNNTIFKIDINVKGFTQINSLAPNDIIYTSEDFQVGYLTGGVMPDFNALKREVEAGRNYQNREKVPVVYVGSKKCLGISTGCGWDFRIVWEDAKTFYEEEAAKRKAEKEQRRTGK